MAAPCLRQHVVATTGACRRPREIWGCVAPPLTHEVGAILQFQPIITEAELERTKKKIRHESNDEDKLRASQMQTNGVRLQQTRLRLF